MTRQYFRFRNATHSPQRSFPVRLLTEERGAYFIMSGVVIIALLAIVGLALDSGTLYRARLAAQKAADAGVIAGLGFAASLKNTQFAPDEITDTKSEIESRAASMARQNLRVFHLSESEAVDALPVPPEYNVAERTLTVNVRIQAPLFLMHLIPFDMFGSGGASGFSAKQGVPGRAVAQIVPANVALVLDTSRSMECPATGTCNCLEFATCGTVERRLNKLKDGAKAFLEYFDPAFDRIALVPYNIKAEVRVPPTAGGGFSFSQLETEINNLTTQSNTNPGDGLLNAYTAMKDLNGGAVINEEETVYVLFSDGAPTAGRFFFAEAKPELPNNNPSGLGNYDYMFYLVTSFYTSLYGAGSSPLLKPQFVPMSQVNPVPPANSIAPCSGFTTIIGTLNKTFGDCLDDLSFYAPEVEGATYGDDITFDNFRRQLYHAPIVYSDFLRKKNGTIHVIGLGDPAAIGTDPYQNIEDIAARKDVFLTRIASDIDRAFGHPAFQYDNALGFSDKRKGVYLSTNDPNQLENLFKKIAQKIKLRLIQ